MATFFQRQLIIGSLPKILKGTLSACSLHDAACWILRSFASHFFVDDNLLCSAPKTQRPARLRRAVLFVFAFAVGFAFAFGVSVGFAFAFAFALGSGFGFGVDVVFAFAFAFAFGFGFGLAFAFASGFASYFGPACALCGQLFFQQYNN